MDYLCQTDKTCVLMVRSFSIFFLLSSVGVRRKVWFQFVDGAVLFSFICNYMRAKNKDPKWYWKGQIRARIWKWAPYLHWIPVYTRSQWSYTQLHLNLYNPVANSTFIIIHSENRPPINILNAMPFQHSFRFFFFLFQRKIFYFLRFSFRFQFACSADCRNICFGIHSFI